MAGPIKSIQKVAITIPSGSTSATATISSITTASAILLFNGNTATQTSDYGSSSSRIELTNATTVTAYRGASNTDSVIVYGTVIEFNSGYLNSVQAGTIALSSAQATNTATISSVGTNAFVVWLGSAMPVSETSGSYATTSAVLTNSTTVTAAQSVTGSATQTVGYMVVDPTASLVSAVQKFSYASGVNSNTSYTQTISSVDTTKTILINNGYTIAASATLKDEVDHTIQLTNATTVTMTRGDGGATEARTVNFTVVTFAAGVLNSSIQRGTIALSASTSNTSTISSVTASLAAVNWTGNYEAAANVGPYDHYQALQLTNGTTVTGTINTAANAATIAYEVIEFVPSPAATLFGGMAWEQASARRVPAPQDASLQRQVSANYYPYPPAFNQAWDNVPRRRDTGQLDATSQRQATANYFPNAPQAQMPWDMPKRRDTGQMDSQPQALASSNPLPEYQPWDNVPRRRDTGQLDATSQRQVVANYFPNAPQAQMPWETPKRRDTGQMDSQPQALATGTILSAYQPWDNVPRRRDTGQLDASSQRQATVNYFANAPQTQMPWETPKRRDTGQMDFLAVEIPSLTIYSPFPMAFYQPWDTPKRRDTGQLDTLPTQMPRPTGIGFYQTWCSTWCQQVRRPYANLDSFSGRATSVSAPSFISSYQPWDTPKRRDTGQLDVLPAKSPNINYFPLPPNSLMPWETPKRRDTGQQDATSSYVPKANVFPSQGARCLGWEMYRGPLRGQYDSFSNLEPTVVSVTPPFVPPSGTTYGMVFIGDSLKNPIVLSDSPATMTWLSDTNAYSASLKDILATWVLASDSLTYTCTLEEIAMNTYDIGSMVQLTALFTDTSGSTVTPSSVVVRVKDPNGTVGTYTPKAQPDGSFAYGYTTSVVGVHYYRFEGSGNIVAVADGTFNVTQSPVFAS